jgi:hypothetical protein
MEENMEKSINLLPGEAFEIIDVLEAERTRRKAGNATGDQVSISQLIARLRRRYRAG